MGRPYIVHPSFENPYYCKSCYTSSTEIEITDSKFILSINITCRYGYLFIFQQIINVYSDSDKVSSLFYETDDNTSSTFIYNTTNELKSYASKLCCNNCDTLLGWEYKSNNKVMLLLLRDSLI